MHTTHYSLILVGYLTYSVDFILHNWKEDGMRRVAKYSNTELRAFLIYVHHDFLWRLGFSKHISTYKY